MSQSAHLKLCVSTFDDKNYVNKIIKITKGPRGLFLGMNCFSNYLKVCNQIQEGTLLSYRAIYQEIERNFCFKLPRSNDRLINVEQEYVCS